MKELTFFVATKASATQFLSLSSQKAIKLFQILNVLKFESTAFIPYYVELAK